MDSCIAASPPPVPNRTNPREIKIMPTRLSLALFVIALTATIAVSLPLNAARSSASPDASAEDLLHTVMNREIAADKNDHTLWMYQKVSKNRGTATTQEIIQSRQGTLHLTLAQDGKPLSPAQQRQERQRIHKLASHPGDAKSLLHDQGEDAQQAQRMLSIIPEAVIPTYGQRRGDLVALNFKPNPQFHPSSHEGRVFLSMAGTIWVNPREDRLAEINGHLINEVKFGGGVLGHLDKGGQFDVVQSEVRPNEWMVVSLHVNMHGKALFFKTIGVQQDETDSDFRRMPDDLTIAQAATMLLQR